jgi:O-antigen/teichoic acid export membrane protein
VLVAGGVLQIGAPISAAIMPRMARLQGEQNYEEVKAIYIGATEFVAVIVVTAGIVLAMLAKPVLYVWTGDVLLAEKTAPILQLYALGNAVLALAAFPYYLQYAKGNLRLHFIGNLVTAIVLIPTIIWAAKNYGSVGAGWAWLSIQLAYLIFWVSYVHKIIEPGINLQWFKAFLPSVCSVSLLCGVVMSCISFSQQRGIALLQIILASLICLVVAVLSSRRVRGKVQSKLLEKFL